MDRKVRHRKVGHGWSQVLLDTGRQRPPYLVSGLTGVRMPSAVLYSLAALLLITGEVAGENIQDYICSQQFTGYKIDYASRTCTRGHAAGCTNPFPYLTLEECLKDFHGKGNICDSIHPCQHGGACLQVTTDRSGRTFKCDCSATGFYGTRCQKLCPHDLSWKRPRQTACIEVG